VNQDLSPEDRTILAALEALESGSGEPLAPDEPTETAEMLARLYTEVLGLIPCELAPAAPQPEVRARLMASVRGEAAPAGASGDDTLPGEAAQEVGARPAPAARPVVSREMPAAPRAALRTPALLRRRSAWPLALAAILVVVLGGLSAWLLQQRAEQGARIDVLQAELAEERQRAEQAVAEARQEMERMRQSLTLVTSPAVTVSPLHPVGEPSLARGMLFVAADHQHWYLAVHDLPPAPPGRDYQLWWVADEGTVSGGAFEARAGEKVELSSETMPANTRDVMITLEPQGGAAAPSGPKVLQAAGVYQIL
jgi:hypothetical protein